MAIVEADLPSRARLPVNSRQALRNCELKLSAAGLDEKKEASGIAHIVRLLPGLRVPHRCIGQRHLGATSAISGPT